MIEIFYYHEISSSFFSQQGLEMQVCFRSNCAASVINGLKHPNLNKQISAPKHM